MTDDWTASVAAERMELDQEFSDRVEASSFNRQQWGLVMTALEWEIENPSDPQTARIQPDTSNLSAILPELDKVGQGSPQGMGGGGRESGSGGGILDSVKGALGVGGDGGGEEHREEAESLATEYAEALQKKLQNNGRWESVCERAQA